MVLGIWEPTQISGKGKPVNSKLDRSNTNQFLYIYAYIPETKHIFLVVVGMSSPYDIHFISSA